MLCLLTSGDLFKGKQIASSQSFSLAKFSVGIFKFLETKFQDSMSKKKRMRAGGED